MKEKANQVPMPIIILAVVVMLGLAGFFIFRTAQNQNGSYTVPMDRSRYQERMREQAGNRSYYQGGQRQGGPGGNPATNPAMRTGR